MLEKKLFCVYCHTSPNGKKYIGITSQKPERRFGINGSRYKSNPHLSAAIEKYGWDAFSHEILYDALTFEEASKLERDLIRDYRTNDRAHGYNHTLGGEGRLGDPMPEHVKSMLRELNTGSHISEEHKRRIGQANKGKKMPAEVREKIRKANVGKKASESTRKKMSEKLIGNTRPAVSVICVETGQTFPSVLMAAVCIGCHSSNISRSIHKGGTAAGYHWLRAEEERAS